jgi:hypothetical protein
MQGRKERGGEAEGLEKHLLLEAEHLGELSSLSARCCQKHTDLVFGCLFCVGLEGIWLESAHEAG